jgi:DNA processing protein
VRAEPGFPAGLRAIDDPPIVLTLGGRPSHLSLTGIALVGSRNASANGRVIALEMARELAAAGFNVVSGLARGIDTAVHRGALEADGATTAVLAGGADIVYPEENTELMAEIVHRGVVVSERPLGAVPRARDFPRRNRLISGLCVGVVVIEAAPQSGSLITARLALEQGREVMAVPGSPLDPRHRGTNRLLRDGAALVERAQDVLELLAGFQPPKPVPAPGAGPRLRPARPQALALDLAPAPTTAARPAPGARPSPWPATADSAALAGASGGVEIRVRHCLGPDPVAVDELVRQCEASVAAIQEALLDLELDGRLERHPGNRVSLRPG